MNFVWNCMNFSLLLLKFMTFFLWLSCSIYLFPSDYHLNKVNIFRSKQNNYDEVVEYVARHLGLDDPSKIRLTSHNCYSQQPKPQPIKYRGAERLTDMLVHYNQVVYDCDIYELEPSQLISGWLRFLGLPVDNVFPLFVIDFRYIIL